jgi:long-chain acyl-CoA synthetase
MTIESADTLTGLFWARVEASGPTAAQLVKRSGRWDALTWSEVGSIVQEAAQGLISLGRRPGDAVALLCRTRAEWVHADFAILSAGCVTVPIYPSYTPEQIAYLVNDAGARTLIVEDAALLGRALAARYVMRGLEQVVVIDEQRALDGATRSWADLRRAGRSDAAALSATLASRLAAQRPEDVATIVYTSGTTGEPKGVVQTHANHVAALRAIAQIAGVKPGDVHLLFLPLAHSFARLEAFVGVHRGLVTAFAQSLDTVSDDLREVRPHFIFGVPRMYEKAEARVMAEAAAGPALRRRLVDWAFRIGGEVSRRTQASQPVPRWLRLRHGLADRAVFRRLHRAFGGRLRFAVSGGAPLPLATAQFFHAAGILIVEGYGLTEACPALTFNRIDNFKLGSVGQALPGVELRIAADGEILARGANIATRGYLNQPEATAETFDAEGWCHTGDIGHVDADGFLYITDRKKELIVTSGGINIAPQPIENRLRGDRLISQAMVYGDRRPYPVALITLDRDELVRVARAHGLLVTDVAALVRHPRILDRVGRTIEEVNRGLPSYARIKKFAVLPGPLTEEAGELTPTQKIKRKTVAGKYAASIEALYGSAAAA